MKRRTILLIGFVVALVLAACSNSGKKTEEVQGQVYFEYNIGENVYCITVDEEENLFACMAGDDRYGFVVCEYNKDGALINTMPIPAGELFSSPNSMAVLGKKMYFSAQNSQYQWCIFEEDTNSNSICQVVSLEAVAEIKKIAICNGRLITLGDVNEREIIISGSPREARLFIYDLTTGEELYCSENIVQAFSVTEDNKLIINEYDSKEGSVFSLFDPISLKNQKKWNNDVKEIQDFAYDGEGVVFYSFYGLQTSLGLGLSYMNLEKDGIADVIPNTTTGRSGLIYKNGFAYIHNLKTQKVERIKLSAYIKDTEPIRMIGSDVFFTPSFTAGHITEFENKTDEELALAVLSNDSDFDVFYMSTRQDISKNLKEKGVYYSLEKEPNVKEYLDSCFPYIKEAATDENGSVWMIPIEVSIPAILYSKNNCEKIGVDFSTVNTRKELISEIEKCITNGNYEYSLIPSEFKHMYMRSYLLSYNSFNTNEFRSLAQDIKQYFATPKGNSEVSQRLYFGNADCSFITMMDYIDETYDSLLYSDEYRLTGLISGEKNPALCTFVCVNPASKNLKSALEYISDICGYMLQLKQKGMMSDISLYPDSEYGMSLYKLYERGEIDFVVPSEIYTTELEQYLNSDRSLDSLVDEADRKLKVYINE